MKKSLVEQAIEIIDRKNIDRGFEIGDTIRGRVEELVAKAPKLKVGDTVKIVADTSGAGVRKCLVGKQGEITSIETFDDVYHIGYIINDVSLIYYFTDDELELVEEPKFKIGDTVEFTGFKDELDTNVLVGKKGVITDILSDDHYPIHADMGNPVSDMFRTDELKLIQVGTPPKTSVVKSLNVNGAIYHIGDIITLNVKDVDITSDISYIKLIGASELSIELSELNVDNIKDVIDKIGIDNVGEPHE